MKITLLKTIKYCFGLMLVGFLVSCTSTKSFLIEIPYESKKDLPDRIQSLTLVNRTVDDKFNNLDTDSLQKLFYQKQFITDTIINDIQASDTTLKALGDLLFETGRYDIVIPEDRFLKFERNSFLTLEMPWHEVNDLCEIYNTDAVLSMDHFKTQVKTNFANESYFDPARDGFITISAAQITIYYEVLFRIYDPAEEKVLIREFMRDTVIWENSATSIEQLFSELTPVKSALSEAGIASAIDFTDIISIVWHENRRQYFIKGDPQLKHAWNLVENNQWEQAMAIWRNLAENSKSKAVKSKAEYNLAVGHELDGDLQKAISWALKSYDTMYRPVTYEYLEVLEQRKNDLKK